MDDVTWPIGANASQRLPAHAWLAAPLVWRSPLWPATAVIVLAFGLLSAFHQVVVGAVQQAETRRAAATAHADATWRCNYLRLGVDRRNCLAILATTPRAQAAVDGESAARPATVQNSL